MVTGKLFTPDNETFIYADDLQQAMDILKDEMEEEYDIGRWEELPLDTIIYALPMVGFGGFNEVYADSLIRKNNIKTPCILDAEYELSVMTND